MDPEIEVRSAQHQVDDCLEEIRKETELSRRVLVTVLTKKLAEDLTKYLTDIGVKAKYLHSDIDTLERVQIINDLRKGVVDVLVGINLLREGLDLPEVSLVAILDADKEGFLRSETSLVQTCGRAARNIHGRVIMYADKRTKSIESALLITSKRRHVQKDFNEKHGIIPHSTKREHMQELLETFGEVLPTPKAKESKSSHLNKNEVEAKIREYEIEMKRAAKEMRFEDAAHFRDLVRHLQQLQLLEDEL